MDRGSRSSPMIKDGLPEGQTCRKGGRQEEKKERSRGTKVIKSPFIKGNSSPPLKGFMPVTKRGGRHP